MVSMPAGHLAHGIQDRALLRPGRLRPLRQLRLRDRLPLRQRQLHPVRIPTRATPDESTTRPTRASWMSQRAKFLSAGGMRRLLGADLTSDLTSLARRPVDGWAAHPVSAFWVCAARASGGAEPFGAE